MATDHEVRMGGSGDHGEKSQVVDTVSTNENLMQWDAGPTTETQGVGATLLG